MWNSNSVVSWLLAESGLPAERIQPPRGGRAPGWRAGVELARRLQNGSDVSIEGRFGPKVHGRVSEALGTVPMI
jgi:hypothetical protein